MPKKKKLAMFYHNATFVLYSSCHVFVRNNRYERPYSLFLFLYDISLRKQLTATYKFTNRAIHKN